jgi:hypothetical protein
VMRGCAGSEIVCLRTPVRRFFREGCAAGRAHFARGVAVWYSVVH